jgi:hypothetical protein
VHSMNGKHHMMVTVTRDNNLKKDIMTDKGSILQGKEHIIKRKRAYDKKDGTLFAKPVYGKRWHMAMQTKT